MKQAEKLGEVFEFEPLPTIDDTLLPILTSAKVEILDSPDAFEDKLAYTGDDICFLVFSTALKDSRNEWIVMQFADLA